MPRRPSHFEIYSLIVLMTLIWSLNYIVAKYALREFPPILASGLRMLAAGAMMLVLFQRDRRAGKIPPLSWKETRLVALLGILGIGLNQLFFVWGISMTTVSHAAIMIGTTPITVLLLASLMGLEKLTTIKLLGMFTALSGVAVLQFSSTSTRAASLVGDMIVLLASLMFSIYTVRGKRETARHDGVVVNTLAYVGTALVLLPVTIGLSWNFDFSRVSAAAWWSLAYMAVFPSVIGYTIYYYALTHVPASRVSAFSYLQPLLATVMAIPLLGEQPTKSLMTGGVLVLAGVFLAERG